MAEVSIKRALVLAAVEVIRQQPKALVFQKIQIILLLSVLAECMERAMVQETVAKVVRLVLLLAEEKALLV